MFGLRQICSVAYGVMQSYLRRHTIHKVLVSSNMPMIASPSSSRFCTVHMAAALQATIHPHPCFTGVLSYRSLLMQKPAVATTPACRTVVKWSVRKGKRKSVKAVIKRFYRLNWGGRGIWVRPHAGKHKKRWKKSSRDKARLDKFVFTNATQSRMLDTMVTKFWRKRFWFVDDPYQPYHNREEFPFSAKYPRPPLK